MSPEAIVAEARRWIGTPYRHGASMRGLGCDCLGLVAGVAEAVTGRRAVVPHYAPDWAEATGRELLQEALDGRLVRLNGSALGLELKRDARALPPPCGEGYRVGVDDVELGPCKTEASGPTPTSYSSPQGGGGAPATSLLKSEAPGMTAGDILLFRWRPNRPASHLGIATGPATMVHAHARACVAEVAVGPAWARRLAGVYRFPESC